MSYQVERPVANGHTATYRNLDPNALENLNLQNKPTANLNDLLQEWKIRFDTTPKFYLKEDFKVLGKLLESLVENRGTSKSDDPSGTIVDLTDYYTKTEIDNKNSQIESTIDGINQLLKDEIDTLKNNSAKLLNAGRGLLITNDTIALNTDFDISDYYTIKELTVYDGNPETFTPKQEEIEDWGHILNELISMNQNMFQLSYELALVLSIMQLGVMGRAQEPEGQTESETDEEDDNQKVHYKQYIIDKLIDVFGDNWETDARLDDDFIDQNESIRMSWFIAPYFVMVANAFTTTVLYDIEGLLFYPVSLHVLSNDSYGILLIPIDNNSLDILYDSVYLAGLLNESNQILIMNIGNMSVGVLALFQTVSINEAWKSHRQKLIYNSDVNNLFVTNTWVSNYKVEELGLPRLIIDYEGCMDDFNKLLNYE